MTFAQSTLDYLRDRESAPEPELVIDHKAEALARLEFAEHTSDRDRAALAVQSAQVHALLAIAEAQS